jgi:hypothetical protein
LLLARTTVPCGKAALRQVQMLLLLLMPQVPLLLLLLSS